MNDRELLELAAKAAGYRVCHFASDSIYVADDVKHTRFYWRPLSDDGDALRLAVKLYMFDGSLCDLFLKFRLEEVLNDSDRSDEEIARRAIVRAAAEIGRNMK